MNKYQERLKFKQKSQKIHNNTNTINMNLTNIRSSCSPHVIKVQDEIDQRAEKKSNQIETIILRRCYSSSSYVSDNNLPRFALVSRVVSILFLDSHCQWEHGASPVPHVNDCQGLGCYSYHPKVGTTRFPPMMISRRMRMTGIDLGQDLMSDECLDLEYTNQRCLARNMAPLMQHDSQVFTPYSDNTAVR